MVASPWRRSHMLLAQWCLPVRLQQAGSPAPVSCPSASEEDTTGRPNSTSSRMAISLRNNAIGAPSVRKSNRRDRSHFLCLLPRTLYRSGRTCTAHALAKCRTTVLLHSTGIREPDRFEPTGVCAVITGKEPTLVDDAQLVGAVFVPGET